MLQFQYIIRTTISDEKYKRVKSRHRLLIPGLNRDFSCVAFHRVISHQPRYEISLSLLRDSRGYLCYLARPLERALTRQSPEAAEDICARDGLDRPVLVVCRLSKQ